MSEINTDTITAGESPGGAAIAVELGAGPAGRDPVTARTAAVVVFAGLVVGGGLIRMGLNAVGASPAWRTLAVVLLAASVLIAVWEMAHRRAQKTPAQAGRSTPSPEEEGR